MPQRSGPDNLTRRPDLFVVGAPKSGTTSLYDYLDAHPEVYMSPVKEPFYFSVDVLGGSRLRFRYGDDEAAYLALFADAGPEKRLGEASTRYLVSRVAPREIHEFQPNARIVIMLRNPVDFMHAFHNERVSQDEEPVTDFAEAMALEGERAAGRQLPAGSNELGAVYHERARFGDHVERWFGEFGRERVHVIVFEDFIRDTATAYAKVLEFLGVDTGFRPPSFAASNPSNRRRGGVYRSALSSPPAQWVAHRLLPSVIGQNRTSRLARQFRTSRINRRRLPRTAMSPELRRQLERDMAADVAKLSGLLERDLAAEWFGAAA